MPNGRPALTFAVAASVAGASVSVSPVAAAAPAGSTEVRIGQAADFTRIEFHGAQPLGVRKDGRSVVLRFGAIGQPDLSRLRITPPRFLAGAEAVSTGGGLELRLALAKGATATLGRADGATFVNLTQEPATTPASAPAAQGGSVRLKAALQGRDLRLSFPWRTPVAAAVFRRGEAIWVVFNAPGGVDLAEAPSALPQLTRIEPVADTRVTALRLIAPPGVRASAIADGPGWSVILSPAGGAATAGSPIEVRRDPASGVLQAELAGGAEVIWLNDPAVGDRLGVVPASGAGKGLAARKSFVEATLLASAQGLAIQPAVDDLIVTSSVDVVRIARPRGLALSGADAKPSDVAASTGAPDLPQAAAMPGLAPAADWGRTGPGGFLARYDALRAAAAAEGAEGEGAPTQARFGLVRFLIGSGLSYEAIGLLGVLAKSDPKLVDTAEFRALRGVARAQAGRLKDAQADLESPILAGDPASALWRGYVLNRTGDWAGARIAFVQGQPALYAFPARLRGRFVRAEAEAALAAGDADAARAAVAQTPSADVDPIDAQGLTLVRARLAEAAGHLSQALPLYAEAEAGPYGALSSPAALKVVQLKLASRAMPLDEALKAMDSLRYRWRGDAAELEVVRALSGLYLGQGRYREALEALRSAGRRLPDLPAAGELQTQLADTFKTLFLDGGADGLQPLQALALFDDFRELTPIGADGDRMVRRLARRLVDVDLLDQAAVLLRYQVDNRLEGAAKAEVSGDLASIYLMVRKPEQALEVIEASRSTLLPAAMTAERRRVEARALMALGRFDHALELVGDDRSAEGLEIRADAAWGEKSWAQAGSALEGSLGDRWKAVGQPLTPADEDKLLRAGIAYSLAQDEKSLARLRARWGRLAQGGRAPDALRIAFAGAGGAALAPGELTRVTSEADAFAGWVARAKARFLARDASPPPAAAPKLG